MVLSEFTNKVIPIEKLQYIELLETIGILNDDNVNIFINAIINNPHQTKTIAPTLKNNNLNNDLNFDTCDQIIKYIDKLKNSSNFLNFVRFLLMNIYSNYYIKTPHILIKKSLVLELYGELPMKNFIKDMIISKNSLDKLIDTRTNFKTYMDGINDDNLSSNVLELYYITKSREMQDFNNFLSHDRKIVG